MLKLLGARQLGNRDTAAVLRVLDNDPVANCMIAARVEEFGVAGRGLQGELWSRGGPTDSLCYSGANLVPLLGDQLDLRAFADRAIREPRVCSSLVGRRELALPLWDMLVAEWGSPRELRPDQPLLATRERSQVAGHERVRQVRPEEIENYLPAAIAMFVEEVGVDPRIGDGGRGYRRRVAHLIAAGRAWALFEDGEVVFKAEVGSVSRSVGQIQGVWTHPDVRGRGIGSAGTATVTNAVVAGGRTASLYVNSYNAAARRVYERIGYHQVATFATVLIE
ncbi:GNAT family N-acetyltransferase [Skermania sp. ID1734]|uniref:GNAT family N-acetyltransferase n=1 Tax=Skermania sp. ID1734 TaxID=2597516 RepID=UPI00117C8434|nr:GNAT family N-acetyltransferase [Skermania sp. ID1734]TSD93538.1 GNAT family N-acetyltransferase [Skermania sp. ID1734]